MKNYLNHQEFISSITSKELNMHQAAFIQDILEVLENNYHNPKFSVSGLAKSMGTNRIYVYRKLKDILDVNASSLIRIYRLHKAKELLILDNISLNKVAIKSGFSNASYFSQCFKLYFGEIPSNFQKNYGSMIRADTLFYLAK